MTLPSSGSLDYNSIRAEFGSASSNVSLSSFIKGSIIFIDNSIIFLFP